MSSKTEVSELRAKLFESMQLLARRLTDLNQGYSGQSAELSQRMQVLTDSGTAWVQWADEWLTTKSMWGRKREDPSESVARGLGLLDLVDASVREVTDLVKAPREAMNAVANAVSRINTARTLMPVLVAGGGDVSELEYLVSLVSETSAEITRLVEDNDPLTARELAAECSRTGLQLADGIRVVSEMVSSLQADIARLRMLATQLDKLAQSVVGDVQAECPADPKSLTVVRESSHVYNKTMDLLDTIDGGNLVSGATVLVFTAVNEVVDALTALEAIQELERSRNYAWRTVNDTNDHIVSTLSGSSFTNARMWELLDEVTSLLASGEVFAAAKVQAQLVDSMNTLLRPALPARGSSVTVDGAGEGDTFSLPVVASDSYSSIGVTSDGGGAFVQPDTDLTALRELVRRLALEVRSLQKES